MGLLLTYKEAKESSRECFLGLGSPLDDAGRDSQEVAGDGGNKEEPLEQDDTIADVIKMLCH